MASIKFCPKCSGIKKKHVADVLERGSYRTGCIGDCVKKRPELEGKAYARVNGKLVVCGSRKKLVKKLAKAVA